MEIAKLFARIGIKADTKAVENFKNQIQNVKTGLIAGAAVVGTASAAFIKLAGDAMNAASAYKQFETETGASAQELQKWESVAGQANVSAQAVAESVKAIASNREALRLGKGSIAGYQLLGINPNQDPFEILKQLRGKMAGLPEAMQKNILSQMGISSQMLQIIKMTNEQFSELAGNAFIISPAAINSLTQAKGALSIASQAFDYLKAVITADLAPAVADMAKGFAKWVKENEKTIIKTVRELVEMIGLLGQAIIRVLGAINNIVTKTVGWQGAIMALVGVFIALNSAVMLPVAGILLLILVIEDLIAFSEGRDSLFGYLLEENPALKAMFDKMAGPMKMIGEIFKEIGKAVQFAAEALGVFAVEGLDGLKKRYPDLMALWGLFRGIGATIEGVFKGIMGMFATLGDSFGFFQAMFAGDWETVKKLGEAQAARNDEFWKGLGSWGGDMGQAFNEIMAGLTGGGAGPALQGASTPAPVRIPGAPGAVNQTNQINITVPTAADVGPAAKGIENTYNRSADRLRGGAR